MSRMRLVGLSDGLIKPMARSIETARHSFCPGLWSASGRTCLSLGALMAASSLAFAQANLLVNPGFETGDITGWTTSYGSYSVVSSNAHAGTYSARVGYGSAVAQIVSGLSPNTQYTCTGWLKESTAGQRAYLIAQNFGGSSVNKSTTNATYTSLSLTFTTGSTNTAAEIVAYQSGTNWVYCDDLSLTGPARGDTNGMQAYRIADCLQKFGVNTFSLVTNGGYPWRWGGSQGTYDTNTTSRAINYITGGSGLNLNIREYHRDTSSGVALTPLQLPWIKAVHQATGSPFSLAIAAYGGSNDIPGIVSMVQDSLTNGNFVRWVEGINEPNMYGPISNATTAYVQASLYQQIHALTTNVTVMGPSIVFGLPYPDGYITNYLKSWLPMVLSNSDVNNLHVYPPKSPNADDGSTRGGMLADINIAFENVLSNRLAINTEYHPTLYSTIHKTNDTYDAYWGPIYLLSSYGDFDWQACFWFALFDYDSSTQLCGLFKTSDADPKPVANAFRALFQLTGDSGTNKLTFIPGKLDVSLSGLPAAPSNAPYSGGTALLFENSAGTYFLMIWNEQNDISAATTPVTVTFNSRNMTKVEEFNITSGSQTALQSLTNVHSMVVNLDTSLRLLRITY